MKAYIGDGVYIDYDGVHLILTTENGVSVTNTIYLEDLVYIGLKEYAESRAWPHLRKGTD